MIPMMSTVLAIVVVLFASVSLYVALAQSKYLYFPDKTIAATPETIGLAFEDLSLKTEDGETIAGWFVPHIKDGVMATQTVLFCHGNAGDIGDRVESIRTFHRLGFNVLAFDYRGFGKSSGRPTEQGTYQDALACWDYLVDKRGQRPDSIVVFGRSLGGAVACWLAVHADPGILVLESVFSSVPDMAAKMFPFLPVRLFCRFKYDNVECVSDVHCPVMVAHSPADRTCPFEQGKRVYEAANLPKQFIEMQGGHNAGGLDVNPSYQNALLKFVKMHTGER